VFRLYLYARVRFSICLLHTRPRVQRAPGIPCSLIWRERNFSKARAQFASREGEAAFSEIESDAQGTSLYVVPDKRA